MASQCLFNSAAALRKVFISNAAICEAPWQLQSLLLPAITAPLGSFPSSPSRRPFSTHHAAQLRYSNQGPASGSASAAKDRAPRDHDILYPWIQLRQEDGTLSEPRRTNQVLKKLNMERNSLVLLAAPRPGGVGPKYPICKITDRKAEEAAQAEKNNAAKKKEKSKELELNWAIAPHDLRTKMAQLKRFLSKGYQVTVTMMNLKKRDKRKASADEAKEVLKAVETVVAEVPGTKEFKAREGTLGDTLIVHLHAPGGAAAAAAAAAASAASAGGAASKTTAAAGEPKSNEGEAAV